MKLLLLGLLAVAASIAAEEIKCRPSSRFQLDCNTCTCTPQGEIGWWTKKACAKYKGILTYFTKPTNPILEPDSEFRCEPNTTYKMYCNTCHCSANGKGAICGRMFCDKNIWNEDGTMKVPPKNVTNILTENKRYVEFRENK